MAAVSEAFAIAIEHHRAGRLQAAEQIYRQILQVEHTHVDALHMLGVINAQTGNHQIAVEYIDRALTVRPNWAEAQGNLGNAFREQGERMAASPLCDGKRFATNLISLLHDVWEQWACARRSPKASTTSPNAAGTSIVGGSAES